MTTSNSMSTPISTPISTPSPSPTPIFDMSHDILYLIYSNYKSHINHILNFLNCLRSCGVNTQLIPKSSSSSSPSLFVV